MSVLYFILVGIVILFFWMAFRKLARSHQIVTPLMGWMVGLSFFLILPLAILVLNGGYEMPAYYGVLGRWRSVDLSDPAYIFPFMVIWTALMLTASTVYVVTPQKSRSIRDSRDWHLSVQGLRRVIMVCARIAFVDWAIRITMVGGIENYFLLHWYTRFDDATERMGYLFVLYQYISGTNQVILTAAVALLAMAFVRQSRDRSYGLLLFAFSMLALNMIMTGNRIYIALFLLYFLTMLIVHHRFRLLFIILLFIPVATIFFSAWSHVRGGFGDPAIAIANYRESISSNDNVVISAIMDVTQGEGVMLLLYIIRDFGSRYDFLFGETYSKAITFIIPRSIYPNKTEHFTVIIAKFYEPGVNTSLGSTAFGEMYGNFGILAVLMLPIFTLVIHWVSRWINIRLHRHVLLSTVLFLLFAWMSRSVFSEIFLIILFSILLIVGLRLEKGIRYPAVNDKILHTTLR